MNNVKGDPVTPMDKIPTAYCKCGQNPNFQDGSGLKVYVRMSCIVNNNNTLDL